MADENDPLAPAKHEHAYKPSGHKYVRLDDGRHTIVLLHCECGDFTHSRVPGEWSWEEIVRQPSATIKSDADVLKAMGISVEA